MRKNGIKRAQNNLFVFGAKKKIKIKIDGAVNSACAVEAKKQFAWSASTDHEKKKYESQNRAHH